MVGTSMHSRDLAKLAREIPSFFGDGSIGTSESLGWNSTWGTKNIEEGHGVWADGNFTYTFGYVEYWPSSAYDVVLIKWDSSGQIIWNRTWGGASNDYGYGIWGDGANLYTCGGTTSYGAGSVDMFLIKWDLDGNVLWYRTWGGTANDGSYGLWGDGAGGIYVGGYTYSSGAGSSDLALVKWDTSGNLQWSRTWGGTAYDGGFSVWSNVSSVYVCGRTGSYGMGSIDLLLVKWDASGTLIWSRTWGGTGGDQGWTVRGDGTNVYTCGNFHSASTNSWDMVLVKWDASGNPLWNRTWGSTVEEEGHALWINGSTIYVSGCMMTGTGWRDIVIVKWDASGDQLWFDTWGHAYNDVCWDLHGQAGKVFCCGSTTNWGTTGTDLVLVQWIDDGGIPSQVSPTITHPADITYTVGQTGYSLSWTITDATTGTRYYTIYQDGYVMASGSWSSGTPVTRSVDGLLSGSYNFTIVATDGLGGSVQDSAVVTVLSNAQPSITHPADITYAAGQVGNVISWTITDMTTGTRSYAILRNGSPVGSGTWTTGIAISLHIDGLSPGTYNFTITATDGLGGSVQDTVLVTVLNVAPSITHPADLSYTTGQVGNVISWIITDATTGTRSYTIYRNSTSITSGTWTSGLAVSRNVDGLPFGIYNFTIVATDGLNGSVHDSVIVTVAQNLAPIITCTIDRDSLVIFWRITDTGTGNTSYFIYHRGVLISNGTWASGILLNESLSNLASGAHDFTIVAIDGLGEQTRVTALVVIAAEPPGNGDPPGGIIIVVIIFAAGATIGIAFLTAKHRACTSKSGKNTRVAAATDQSGTAVEMPSLKTPPEAISAEAICPRCGNPLVLDSRTGSCCDFCGERFDIKPAR